MSAAASTALVTGGAKRIGKAIVEDLAAHGFAVAVHANNSLTEADALAARIREAGGRAAALAADLTDMDAVGDLVGRAGAALGPVTLLVNNASLFVDDSVQDFTGRPGIATSPSISRRRRCWRRPSPTPCRRGRRG